MLVSGQYASDEQGAVVTADFAGRVAKAFDNVRTALRAHGLDLDAVVQLRSYVVDHDFGKLGALTGYVSETWAAPLPTQTMLGVASLATPEVLFEVEAVAVGPTESGT